MAALLRYSTLYSLPLYLSSCLLGGAVCGVLCLDASAPPIAHPSQIPDCSVLSFLGGALPQRARGHLLAVLSLSFRLRGDSFKKP